MKKKRGTIDIESFPGHYRGFVDKMWKTRLLKETIPIKPASFSYKELGKHKPYTRGVWEFKNEKEFVKDLHRVFMENEELIGHNAKQFDLKQSNTFFAMYGLPDTNVKIIDTLTIVKKKFRLPSYKLKYCLEFFKIGHKLETGGEVLWFDVEDGDPKARKHFLKYNENDTVKTELLYLYFLDKGWVQERTRKCYGKDGCIRCGGHNVNFRGEKPFSEGVYEMVHCKDCNKHQPYHFLRGW